MVSVLVLAAATKNLVWRRAAANMSNEVFFRSGLKKQGKLLRPGSLTQAPSATI